MTTTDDWVFKTNPDCEWYSIEWSPWVKCWVKLDNLQECIAIYVMGKWETIEGEVLTGVIKWAPLEVVATRGKRNDLGRNQRQTHS